jgi:hypothetical protein
MTIVLARFQVADYDAFKPGYDRAMATISEIRSHRVWRGQDDPKLVVITETFDSREVAEALWTSQATQDAMASDGIDMSSVQIDYLDEVGP